MLWKGRYVSRFGGRVRPTATYVLIATIATTGHAAAQNTRALAVADSDTVMRAQAKVLLQGADTLPWLSEARIALVAHALRVIHSSFPQLADADSDAGVVDGGAMVVYFADSVFESVLVSSGAQRPKGDDPFWHTEVRHVGIPALDSLDAKYGVKRAIVWSATAALSLEFARPANIPVIRAEYLRIPQVKWAMNPWNQDLMGITFFDKGSRLDFVFGPRSPCVITCGPGDVSYIAYDTLTQTATMEHHVPRDFPRNFARWSDSIAYWDVPSQLTITPYPDLDSLLAGMHADLWWYRSHAVAVLANLLGPSIAPWQGGRERSPGQFQKFKLAALARRQEILSAIIARLDDVDPTVARTALDGLLTVSRQHFGSDAAGVAHWRHWLHDLPKQPAPLEIRFINVGQGDAILIRQGKQAALVDAGPANDSIVDRLRTLGVDALQLFVATIDQPDHVGSAAAVRSAIPIATFIDDEHMGRRTIRFGDTRIEIIPPLSRQPSSQPGGGAMVRISRGSFQALLTGGAGRGALDSLVARDRLGQVNVAFGELAGSNLVDLERVDRRPRDAGLADMDVRHRRRAVKHRLISGKQRSRRAGSDS